MQSNLYNQPEYKILKAETIKFQKKICTTRRLVFWYNKQF